MSANGIRGSRFKLPRWRRNLKGRFFQIANIFRHSATDAIAVVRHADQNGLMTSVIYLSPGEDMPDHGDDTRWLRIEASDDGWFFGSGGSFKANGDWVGYGSLAEDDVSLEAALAAAQRWAAKYDVPTIWIQLAP